MIDLTSPTPVKLRSGIEDHREVYSLLSSDEDDFEMVKGDNNDIKPYIPINWQDPSIISRVEHGVQKITKNKSVIHTIHIDNCLPEYYPVPRVAEAYVVHLDDPKFTVSRTENGPIMTPDHLIANKVRFSRSL